MLNTALGSVMFSAFGRSLGSNYIENSDSDFKNAQHRQKFENSVGIRGRYVEPSGSAVKLALESAFIAIKEIDKKSIKMVLFMSQTNAVRLPATACLIQAELGLSSDCLALDLNQGCSGFVYSYWLANLLSAKLNGAVLVVHSDVYQSCIGNEDQATKLLFSDASFAYLTNLPENQTVDIVDTSFMTDGTGADRLYCSSDEWLGSNYNHITSDDKIHMDGASIYNFVLGPVCQSIGALLTKNKINQKDINLFVPHQANSGLLKLMTKKIGIDEKRVHIDLAQYANTVSCSIPFALTDSTQPVSSGDTVLISGFGVGLSVANMLISIK